MTFPTFVNFSHIDRQFIRAYVCHYLPHYYYYYYTCARGAHILGEYSDSGVCDVGEGEVQVEETRATSGYVLHH